MRKALAALALLFLAAHVPFLPPTLEDIDSINFALGVADFDVARHQPHPPGYPVFIALGKISTAVLRAAGVPSPEPRGLAIWSALSGAALIVLLFAFFRALGGNDDGTSSGRGPATARSSDRIPPGTNDSSPHIGETRRNASSVMHDHLWLPPSGGRTSASGEQLDDRLAFWATVIVALSPLFWFTALRPLSDMTGLAAGVAAQALIASVITGRGTPRALMWGAFAAGMAIGIRSQTFLLTLPLLALALVLPRVGLRLRDRIAAIAAVSIGVVLWGIPLIVASGGLASYAAALGSQAGEDFSGVVMLWNMRLARVALDALTHSFLWPWGSVVAGSIVVAVAAIGCVRVTWRMPRALGLLAVAFVPYAIFHLLFHETVTVRYALPLLLPVAYLVACALEWGGRVALMGGAAALVAWSLLTSVPAAVSYGREGSPALRALREAAGGGARDPAVRERVLAMHAVARRTADWLGPALPLRVLKAPHGREWLTLIQQWRAQPQSIVSFVADPRRTDLALIDPSSRIGPMAYVWGFVEPPFVGGARPGDSDVYAMSPPGWMLERGWALTPEVAGVTAKDGLGPHRKPSVAWIRTRSGDATLMLGGRHLGAAGHPEVRISLSLNGRPLESFTVKPGFFFKLFTLPPGTLGGASAYIPLEVKSDAADGREIAVALEQFDLQSPGTPMAGAEEGWQEPEYNPLTARSWRWMSERSTLWVRPIGRDVTLTLTGESPLRYYDSAPAVTVTAAGRQIARFTPSSDFTQDVVLPADALASAAGRVVIDSDKWFVPGERDGTDDRRHLSLRIYSFSVK